MLDQHAMDFISVAMDFNPYDETSSHPIPPRCSVNSPSSSMELNEPTGFTHESSVPNYLRTYMDLLLYDMPTYGETSSHIPINSRCSSTSSSSSSIDLNEPTGFTHESSVPNYLRTYMDLLLYDMPTYGETSSHIPINSRCSSTSSSSSSIDLNEPTGETNRSSSANCLRSHIDFYEPYINSETGSLERSCLPNSLLYDGSPERIQHGMNFNPTDETSSLQRSSSAGSLPSVDSFEQSIYFDAQLPEPFDLETNNQPLPSYRVENRPTIGREAPFDRDEFSGWNQHSMLPVLGPTGETIWEAIQRLDREFLHWRRTSLEAMQQNRDLKFRVQLLENSIVDLLMKNKDLEIRKNHSELEEMYLETTNNRVIKQLKDKVVGLELIITRRDLHWLTITTNEINFQMTNLEAKFTQLKDEVSQLKVPLSSRRTKVTRITCVNKLKDAINDLNRCMSDVKENIDQLISEICKFSSTVEDMETSDTVTELKMKTNNLEMQIIQLFERASELKKGLVPLEKTLEMEQVEASRETTTGEVFAQFLEDLKRALD